jgi:hypothetical protein
MANGFGSPAVVVTCAMTGRANRERARAARRSALVFGALVVVLIVASPVMGLTGDGAGSTPLVLATVGRPRALPQRLLGASADPFYEHLIDSQVKTGMLASMHLAYTRFPGGTVANYYDWKRGLIFVTGYPNSSAYTNYWVTLAGKIATTFPDGISFEQFKPFADALGAEVVLVPNLETATVADQTAWLAGLAGEGVVPTHIELGNEFWVAMGNDPNVIARWPDEPTSMAISKQYLDAFRPYLPAGAKVAVQAAPGSFWFGPADHGAFWDRLRGWNDDLHPEDWFDAVTTHLYPRLEEVTGDPNANFEPVTPELAQRNYTAMMALHDDGADQNLNDLESRVPGKEIWITEWNPRGGSEWQPGQTHPITPSIALALTTRMLLTCLRHPSVTVNLYFMMSFLSSTPYAAFVPSGSSYAPLPAVQALAWFCEAANGGATYQRLVEAGAARLPGGGTQAWTYAAIEGAVFNGGPGMTMILQNAAATARSVDLTQLYGGKVPLTVETMSMPDLADTTQAAAVVSPLAPSLIVTLAPYSVTRLRWPATPHPVRRHLHGG